jgi:hypothetical protein
VITIGAIPIGVLAALLGIPLVLFAPGYAIVATLDPSARGEPPGLLGDRLAGIPEKFALSIGISAAVAALTGLALNLTPWGLTSNSWVMVLAILTILAAMIAAKRREFHSPPRLTLMKVNAAHVSLMAMAVVIVALASGIGWWGAQSETFPGYTQLWITPSGGNAFEIGVRNVDPARERYKLTLDRSPGGSHQWPSITVGHGATWRTEVVLPPRHRAVVLRVNLYLATRPGVVYRHVRLNVPGAVA